MKPKKLKKAKAAPVEIYATACQFVFLTGFASNQEPPMAYPLITNCCLSIELLLKTLVASENNDEFATDHSLFRLVRALEQTTKDEIAKGGRSIAQQLGWPRWSNSTRLTRAEISARVPRKIGWKQRKDSFVSGTRSIV